MAATWRTLAARSRRFRCRKRVLSRNKDASGRHLSALARWNTRGACQCERCPSTRSQKRAKAAVLAKCEDRTVSNLKKNQKNGLQQSVKEAKLECHMFFAPQLLTDFPVELSLASSPSAGWTSPAPCSSTRMIDLTSVDFERDYRVLKEIGRGRFGEAVSVEHLSTGEQYALKRTRFGSSGQPDAQKVQVEAKALARLQHPNVIRYHATFSEPGAVCILMELATGGDLGSVLARRWQEAEAEGKHELPEEELMNWFVQLAAGLEHVHKMRVLHRDLKPENVFVSGDGTAKLGDFGIARILQVARPAPSQ